MVDVGPFRELPGHVANGDREWTWRLPVVFGVGDARVYQSRKLVLVHIFHLNQIEISNEEESVQELITKGRGAIVNDMILLNGTNT
jgi:hypothetical protein